MQKQRLDQVAAEFNRWNLRQDPLRVLLGVGSLEVDSLLGRPAKLPTEVIEAAKAVFGEAEKKGQVRGFRVHSCGPDLLFHASTVGGASAPNLLTLFRHASLAALEEAKRRGILSPDGSNLLTAGEDDYWRGLSLRVLFYPYTERGAEAILVAKLVDGGPGGFNRMLFNLFFHLDKGSHQRLDSTRFVVVVEHLPSLSQAAAQERRVFVFGDRPEEEVLTLLYPFSPSPLVVSADNIGDVPELLSLIANPAEWAVSAVYAVRGRFVRDGDHWQPTRHEPVAAVSIHGWRHNGAGDRPVCVVRLQSGLPAVGEAHASFGGEPQITIGGPSGSYHLAVMPVTLADAIPVATSDGLCRLIAYSYQSYDQGRIPPPHDVVDLFAQDSVETRWLQSRAVELARCMAAHGEFQPYVVAEEAERRARAQARELEVYFQPIPSTEGGDVDPIVRRCCERSGARTLTDIKADAGGKLGHTSPPTLFLAVANACLAEARENNLLLDGCAFAVGDDLHLLMTHDRGVDANDIHLFAFRTFWRAVWVTQVVGYKPYGLAQDLKIGPATKGKAVEELAQPTSRFLDLLGRLLPQPELGKLDALREAWERWQRGHSAATVAKPFAGNVTGQGPGFAELPTAGLTDFALVAADKAGPAAFNLPLFRAAEMAIREPDFRARYGSSIAFEIFDVHAHRRVFLDITRHGSAIERLLGATNLFNVKRLWALPEPVADVGQVQNALSQMLLAASTEKLAIIAGGEYVGKDDPVLIGVRPLVEYIFSLMRDGFYLTQGDERGSHYMMLVPKPLHEAVATVRSRGLEVGLRLSLGPGAEIQFEDVFAGPEFTEARQRVQELNFRLWSAQGSEFTPIGVGAHDVEPAYPLMKVLSRITAPDSPYAIRIPSPTAGSDQPGS